MVYEILIYNLLFTGKASFENLIITGEPTKSYLLAIKNTKISDFFAKHRVSQPDSKNEDYDDFTAYIKIRLRNCDIGEIYLEREQSYFK